MTIAVTAATGNLGRLVVEALLRTVPASEVVAVVRDAEKAADLAARGVAVRVADYNDSASLDAAFEGVERVLLISGTDFGSRARQHAMVIDAAAKRGVSLLAYTSVLQANERSINPVATEHVATEAYLRASGVPFVLLRNGWYLENFVQEARGAAESGVVVTSAGAGRVATATRAEYAEAAAVVLTTDGHEGRVYELSGAEGWTKDEFAATVGEILGATVAVKVVTPGEQLAILTAAGVPEMWAGFGVAVEGAIAAGELDSVGDDLEVLIGRKAAPLRESLAAALAA
jgi:NAD(P)H dehydrogenase (quinone)